MRPFVLLSFALAACAGASAPATTAPAPASVPASAAPRTAPATPPAPSYSTPPADWQLLDAVVDGVQGTGARRAEKELLAGRKPARTVLVAVLDGGVDTAHADLRAHLWHNPREVVDGKDDDGDGLVDDTFGWNYLGGADGRNVNEDTIELTREFARCERAKAAAPPECTEITASFEAKRAEAEQEAAQLQQVGSYYDGAVKALQRAMPGESLTVERVTALAPTSDTLQVAREIYLQLSNAGVTPKALADAIDDVDTRMKYGLNPGFNPRTIVGDDPTDTSQRAYGNRDVTGPDADHGTHVAGIIGAVRRADGTGGVATNVQVMSVRVVPDGDEHDKDIANGIRYAVDHGAQIINMSFGKGYSPQKGAVDDAVKYAEQKGVLLVHAAGNEGENLADGKNFPTAAYLGGGRAANWIEVGASSWRGSSSLAAEFSNYGQAEVDLFAPGVDILSTVPGGAWERNSGTSMAAPVVSGVAAMLMSYFPKLTAADVKRILLESAARYPDLMVVRPGAENGEKARFGDLSATGGVVDAYAAVKAALAAERNAS
jgi:subtilisin family serine protease